MPAHVIVGAGPVGAGTARLLADRGHDVRLVSRSGRGPRHERIELVALDLATDVGRLRELATGAAALYNCVNPPYHRWPVEWPPMAAALLSAAEHTGAVLVTMSNLYGYGPVGGPMTEDLPLATTGSKGRVRARMWADALAAHRAGRARVTEARAADFFGPHGVHNSVYGERLMPRLLAGRSVSVLGDPDMPHSYAYLPDVSAALATLGTDERAVGRAWHVPSLGPLTARELVRRLAEVAGVEVPKVRAVPWTLLRAVGVFAPAMRELIEVRYQFDRPFLLDSSAFTTTFGVEATPLDDAVKTTVAWWQDRTAA
jgi:nucleoside-diphosphate-sugar epimerase